jgi:DNA-binding IclR family transcriptional regulator
MIALTKDEEFILECIDSLAKKGLPLVPMSVAVRSGMPIDKCSTLLESLRAKGYLGDA